MKDAKMSLMARLGVFSQWDKFSERVLEYGVTAEDMVKVATEVKPEVYQKMRDEFCKTMDNRGLNYNFGHLVNPAQFPEPTMADVSNYFHDLLDRMVEEHDKNGKSKLWARWDKELDEYSVNMFIFQSSVDGTEFRMPELHDQVFTLTKVKGCDSYKYSCNTERYVTTTERRRILNHCAEEMGVV